MTTVATTEKTALTKPEASRLVKLEETIRSGMRTFFDVGSALQEIRDGLLYREAFSTFEEYCKQRWEFTRAKAYYLIAAKRISENLSTIVDIQPQTESQVRPLAKLNEKQQRDVWAAAVARAPEVDGVKHVTAKLVSTVVNEMKKPPAADGDSEATETDEPERLNLAVALSSLSKAVMGLRWQWPEESLDLMVRKLRQLADTIEEDVPSD